jgi:hypothetical protein
MVKSPVSRTVKQMGDSGRRKERIKIPLIGWEGTPGEKDARSRGSIAGEFPKLNRVKLKAVFLRGLGKGAWKVVEH